LFFPNQQQKQQNMQKSSVMMGNFQENKVFGKVSLKFFGLFGKRQSLVSISVIFYLSFQEQGLHFHAENERISKNK
jgi:hypothetical protein